MGVDQSELPASWAMASLGEVASKPQYGWTTKAAADGENLKLLRTSDISSGRVNWETVPTCVDEPPMPEKYFLDPGDIVVARAGSVGKSFLIRERVTDAVFASYLVRFRPQIRPEYIDFFMQSRLYWEQIEDKSSGIAIPNVNASKLAAVTLPVAPRDEQDRIVEKIETLFAELDKGEEALHEVQKLLARYRQSVLKAAVTGTLTADWRAANGPPKETGKDLLTRILKTRRETWQGRGKYKEPAEPAADGLPELPEGWTWASLDQLILKVEAGKNYRCEERPPTPQETGIVKISAVTWEEFDEDESKTILKAEHVDGRYLIETGDLLISRANTLELVGASVVVGMVRRRLQLSDKVLRLRCVAPIENWLNFVLRSPLGRDQIQRMATGAQMSMRNISQKNLARICIPLPPKNEIERLVTEIADLRNAAKRMLGDCEEERKRSAALRQSILKDAFSGNLVPQDPSDEPAEELLERIRAARAEKPNAKRRKAAA